MELVEISNDLEFNEIFDEIISSPILEIINASIKEWIDAQKPDELVRAANNYNSRSIISSINLLISKIENWFADQHNTLIKKTAYEESISPERWLIKECDYGWLSNNIQKQLNDIESSILEFENAIINVALFIKNNSGFINNIFLGLEDPWDAIKGIFGKSKLDKAWHELDMYQKKTVQQMAENFCELDKHVKITMYTSFATKTSKAIEEIHFYGEEERIKKIEEEKNRVNSIGINKENDKKHSNVLFSLLIVAIIIIISLSLALIYSA